MTGRVEWVGLLGTILVAAGLGLAVLREPDRLADASATLEAALVAEGMDLYAHNCVVCHGASGEGIAAYPPLLTAAGMDAQTLFHTIERGRYNTAMAAFGADEGGVLTGMQVESLVVLLQAGPWDAVAARVAALGLTPPEIAAVEVSDETYALVGSLPDGDILARGLTVYAENCAACHGANGEGSALAPALNSDDVRARLTDADISRVLQQGVAGTLMASWSGALDSTEQQAVVALIGGWEALNTAGVALPVMAPAPLETGPEVIASGENLFNLLCTQCHGVGGYGSRIAPALNNLTFLSQTPDAAIQQIIAGGVTGTSMPGWAGYLTEADIAAISVYIRSLEAAAPIVVPAQP